MLRLDRNINLCCDYMLRLHVAISCCNQMSIFQLDFPFLLLSISQNWNSAFTIAFFGLDFPSPLLSFSQNWDSAFITAFFKFSTTKNYGKFFVQKKKPNFFITHILEVLIMRLYFP